MLHFFHLIEAISTSDEEFHKVCYKGKCFVSDCLCKVNSKEQLYFTLCFWERPSWRSTGRHSLLKKVSLSLFLLTVWKCAWPQASKQKSQLYLAGTLCIKSIKWQTMKPVKFWIGFCWKSVSLRRADIFWMNCWKNWPSKSSMVFDNSLSQRSIIQAMGSLIQIPTEAR